MRVIHTLLVASAVMLLCNAALADQVGDNDRIATQVDAMFAKYDRPDVPGCAVGIICDGKLIYCNAFGSANLDYQIAITPQTSFDVASVTKSFTTACVALLMDQHKLRLEDDIRKYLPEIHDFEPHITVGDLLRCHSGLRDYIHLMPLAGWLREPGWVDYTEADVLRVLAAQRTLHFPTGAKLGYSNSDYFLLGKIVERVSGKSLSRFAKENVFAPLGMSQTGFLDRPADVHLHRAVGYEIGRDGRTTWFSSGSVMGACGVHTCIEDLFRWDQNFYDNRLPRGKHVDAFIRDGELAGNRFCLDTDAHTKKSRPNASAEPAGQYRGLKRMQFTGGGWGSLAAIVRFPDQRFTVVCLTNNEEIIPWEVAEEIVALYFADLLAPPPSRAAASKAAKSAELKSTDSLSDNESQSLVGSYLDDIGRIWKISFDGGTLTLTHDRFGTFRLEPTSRNRFRPVDFPFEMETIRFEPRAAKPRASLIYEWPHGACEFKPFDPPELTDQLLEKYSGDYYSDELLATYRIRVHDGSLRLQVNDRVEERLTPTNKDLFVPSTRHAMDARIFRFSRGKAGDIDGLEIDNYRARGVRLERAERK